MIFSHQKRVKVLYEKYSSLYNEEKFIFGFPEKWEEKFKRIEKYYKYIASREEGKKYSTVNVRYKGQIICR